MFSIANDEKRPFSTIVFVLILHIFSRIFFYVQVFHFFFNVGMLKTGVNANAMLPKKCLNFKDTR